MRKPKPATIDNITRALRERLGDRVERSDSILDLHARDESYMPSARPDLVVFAESTDDVVATLRLASRHEVPVVPFGAGSSLEGHVLAIQGGISLDLTRMDRVLAIRPDDLDVTVEAGVTRKTLARRLEDHGLFFSVDPGADATLGGMAATGASGTTTVRYGTMRENVLALEVVLADGRLVRTGGRARKSSAGYDLTRLMIGSEGTLGVITELTLKVHGIPEAIAAAVCAFPTLESAVDAAVQVIQWGVPVARVELLDEVQVDAVNRYAGLDHEVLPTLFFELHGSPESVDVHARAVAEIAGEHGGTSFRFSQDQAEREALWRARHDAYFADLALRPGARVMSTDVCVPISRLVTCIRETKADTAKAPFPVPLVGHVGDGNFHLLLVIDPDDESELEAAKRINSRLVERALALGGTSSGEHGVGIGKRRYMRAEHGTGVEIMRAVKQALDPHGILNPGKVIPDAVP